MGVTIPVSQPATSSHCVGPCPKDSPIALFLSSVNFAKDMFIPVASFKGTIDSIHKELDRRHTLDGNEAAAGSIADRNGTSPCSPEAIQKLLPNDGTTVSQPSNSSNGAEDRSCGLLRTTTQHKPFTGLSSWGLLDEGKVVLQDIGQNPPSFCQCKDHSKQAKDECLMRSNENQIASPFLAGLLPCSPKQDSCASPLQCSSCSTIRDTQEIPFINELQKHMSGLSLQGLSCIFSNDKSHCKPDYESRTGDNPMMCTNKTEEPNEFQKPFLRSFFQIFVEQCHFANSNLSKHAGQWMSWTSNSLCTIDDSKDQMMSSEGQTPSLKDTLADLQLSSFSSSSFTHDFAKGNKQSSLRSVPLGFARVRGEPNAAVTTSCKDEPGSELQNSSSSERDAILKTAAGLFNVSLPNIERLRSTLSAVSLTELMELVPQIGKASQDFPDKKKLFSVQDFFRYTEAEGRRFFEELDRDHDGEVTLEDLEVAMRKRRLPQSYAREFLRRTRKHWFAKSFGWSEFLSLMEQKEPMMLRAYNSLSLSKFGTLQKGQLLASLRSAGLPATEENAAAMIRCLDAETKGSIAYGQFRNFMLLLPPERLEDDPRMVWFETATVVPMAPPVTEPAESVLKSALAGGLACALSTSLMHPVDTIKTRVQASTTLSFPELLSKLPEIGVRGLYRGSIPAILGQFSSHGLRTGIFEASKMLLTNMAPNIPELQVQSLASFCSTVLGTAMRIPCEVLKQRLQAGLFDNVGDAFVGTWQQDGAKGFFRGTGATLCREVPFYVAGMGIYAEAKKVLQRLVNRELAPWETIAIGALSGGLAAVCTTPFDVMKTRAMTAAPGMSTRMSTIAVTIVREEGVMGLFKGAVPRFFWIAPLGAMNFAGYELAKRALENKGDQAAD